MIYYLQVQNDGTITDAISYPYGDYTPFETDQPLPIGVYGGWFKLEDGVIVEYPELKPLTPETEIEKLKQENTTLQSAVSEITMYVAEQDAEIEQQNQTITELSILIAGGM